MSRKAVCCVCCLLAIIVDIAVAAPLTSNSKLSAYFDNLADSESHVIEKRSAVDERQKRETNHGSNVYVEFREDAFDRVDDLTGQKILSRRKRHTVRDTDSEKKLAGDIMNFGDDGNLSGSERRKRRSAAFILHAAIELCNQYPYTCGLVHFTEEDFKMTIRIADE